MDFIFVGLGGFLGGVLRSFLSNHFNKGDDKLKHGTFYANVLGSLILGILLGLIHKNMLSNSLSLFAGMGFCGGFTTFSTFSLEMLKYIKHKKYMMAFLYLLASVGTCMACVLLGLLLVIGLNGMLSF